MSFWCISRLVATGGADALHELHDIVREELLFEGDASSRSDSGGAADGSRSIIFAGDHDAASVLWAPARAWRLIHAKCYVALTVTTQDLPTREWLSELAADFPELGLRVRSANLGLGWFAQLDACLGTFSGSTREQHPDCIRAAVASDFGFDARRIWRHPRGRRYPGNLLALVRGEPRRWPGWVWPEPRRMMWPARDDADFPPTVSEGRRGRQVGAPSVASSARLRHSVASHD